MSEFDFVGSEAAHEIRKAQDVIFDLEKWLRSNGYAEKEYRMAFDARCKIGDIENSIRFKFKHAAEPVLTEQALLGTDAFIAMEDRYKSKAETKDAHIAALQAELARWRKCNDVNEAQIEQIAEKLAEAKAQVKALKGQLAVWDGVDQNRLVEEVCGLRERAESAERSNRTLRDLADGLEKRLRIMCREWREAIGGPEDNRTPGDVLEKAEEMLETYRSALAEIPCDPPTSK